MDDRVRQHHRATLRHIAELQAALDHAIRRTRELADEAPESQAFTEALEAIGVLHARIHAARQLAISLNRMLPAPNVRLVPPTPVRFPTPRPHRGRSWARVVRMAARPLRSFKTPT
jgi:hypothetical protein